MDQVSRPLLGLLVAIIGLAGAWMLVVRPHAAAQDSSSALPTPPPITHSAPKHTAPGAAGLGRAIDHAKAAVGTANKSVSRTETAVSQAGAAPAARHDTVAHTTPVAPKATPVTHTATPVKPTSAPVKHATVTKPAAPVTRLVPAKPATPAEPGSALVNSALAAHKSVVLLFAGDGSDDAVARQVVRAVRGPKVVGIVASIDELATYDSLLTNVDVSAAPTIVVIGPDRQASEIVGLPDVKQVQSALRTVNATH